MSLFQKSLGAFFLAAVPLLATEPLAILLTGPDGPYTTGRWKADWPGCEWQDGIAEGNASLVTRGSEKRLRVDYRVGEIGPEKNGVGWRYPVERRESAELVYIVRFGKDFDWVKGGKLPGLCGGPENVSGGRPADGTNGFSARLMWRRDGRGEAYLYHKNQPDRYGDRVPFPEDFHFPEEQDLRIRMRVTMNHPGRNNGIIQVWIRAGEGGERELVNRRDLEWRSVDHFGIDALYFETFHGGSDKSWAPRRPSHAEFGAFVVNP